MQDVLLDTSRLHLRSVEPGDEEYLFREIDADLTRHWIGWEPPESVTELRSSIEQSVLRAAHETCVELVAFHKDTTNFIGSCHILPYEEYSGEYEIGLWVKKPEQGKGYATEMLDGLVGWARRYLKVPYLVYSVTEGNGASASIVKKLNVPVLREFTATKRGVERRVTDYRIDL